MSTNNHNSHGLNNKILNLMKDAGLGKPSSYTREFLLNLTPQSFSGLSVRNQYDVMTRLSWLATECEDDRFKTKFLELYPIMQASQNKISEYVQFQLNKERQHA